MDIATILGLAAGLALVFASMISGGDGLLYMHLPSILITFGGTIASMMIHFPARQVKNAFAIARQCFITSLPEPTDVIVQFRTFATATRREGLLSLEQFAIKESDSFIRLGLELVASNCSPALLKDSLQREMSAIEQRHLKGRRLFEAMAAAAPAWGMTGTLIGLVQMLRYLDDPRMVGPGLALALLTTLYGALLANLFCIPMAGKLEARHAEEIMIRQVMVEGFLSLLEEHSPGIIEERLRAWIPPQERTQELTERSRAA